MDKLTLTCARCEAVFNPPRVVGYCEPCQAHYRDRQKMHADAARPLPGYHLAGGFDAAECPKSASCGARHGNVCGVCGGEIHPEYGVTPYGLGIFSRCLVCHLVLDFHPEKEE